jgi:hypothetical protein
LLLRPRCDRETYHLGDGDLSAASDALDPLSGLRVKSQSQRRSHIANTHQSTVLRSVIHGNCGSQLLMADNPSIGRASTGACSIVCKATQRDREATLDRCVVRMRAGDGSEEARQGRQRLRPPRELACRYLPRIRSALHQAADAPPLSRFGSGSDESIIRNRRNLNPI